MKRSIIAAVMALVGLTGCAQNGIGGQSATGRTPWELLVLLLAGVVLYLAFSGLVALFSRRAPPTGDSFDLASRRVLSRPKHAHRHRDRLIDSGRGPDRAIDRTSAADPAPRPPAP